MLTSIAFAGALLLTQTVQQFDLVCAGTSQSSGDHLEPSSQPFDIRYRIDLRRKLWCAADCASPQPIQSVTDTELLLQESTRETAQTFMQIRRSVDRMSGAFSTEIRDQVLGVRGYSLSSGSCERAPYTTIPQQRF